MQWRGFSAKAVESIQRQEYWFSIGSGRNVSADVHGAGIRYSDADAWLTKDERRDGKQHAAAGTDGVPSARSWPRRTYISGR